ncbi:MAG: hypothetical protein JSU97_04290 [Dehalococcoidia bacterium]|nr:MAG: hypothetical protein JSU97_04290 [Dehalococcoidia bacterium]
MGKPAWIGLVSAIVLAFICGGIYAFTEGSHVAEAQPDTVLAVDTNPAGNTATSLATINSCISVNSTDIFYIDVVVMDVTDLNSYDGTFRFDGTIVEVTGVDVEYFLATAPGSSVTSYSGSVPNNSGSFQVSAYDYGEAPESGEGVLARLEITAIGPGISKANFDLRPDGYPISGVILLDGTGTAIGDTSEPPDDMFDGSILEAKIAVDQPCPGECLPGVDTDGDGFDDDIECYLPTDQNDDCTDEIGVHDAWPLDINIDRSVTVVGDVFFYADKIGLPVGGDPLLQRLDLSADGDITVVGDVLPFSQHIGDECS